MVVTWWIVACLRSEIASVVSLYPIETLLMNTGKKTKPKDHFITRKHKLQSLRIIERQVKRLQVVVNWSIY